MSILGYIILGILIAILLLIYVLFVLSYLGSSKSYKEAMRTTATVIEDLGDLKMSVGSFAIGVPRYRTFHKYKVSFYLDGEQRIEEAELKNCHLKAGETTEIRYSISKKGKLLLESEAFLCWTREMAIGYTLGLVFGIVLAVLKLNGMID